MRLSELKGADWAVGVVRLIPGLNALVRGPETEKLLRRIAARHPSGEAVTALLAELRRVTAQVGLEEPDEDVLWLFRMLRRHPAHRVAGEVMILREAACRELTEAALEEQADLQERERLRERLLMTLRSGVSELLGLEEQLMPDPGEPSSGYGRMSLSERLLDRLEEWDDE